MSIALKASMKRYIDYAAFDSRDPLQLVRERWVFAEIENELHEKAYFLEAITSINETRDPLLTLQTLTDVTMFYLEKMAPWLAADCREADKVKAEERLNKGPTTTITGESVKGFDFDTI